MNIEIKKPADIESGLVFGTTLDGSIVVRGNHSAVVLKGDGSYPDGDGWTEQGAPSTLESFPPGTVITITV